MDFDGRDEKISKVHSTLNSQRPSPDDNIKRYTDPWLPAFYDQFNDFTPKKPAICATAIDDIHGLNAWSLPVTDVVKHLRPHAFYFEQHRLGSVEITEVPDYETGEIEYLICLVEVEPELV